MNRQLAFFSVLIAMALAACTYGLPGAGVRGSGKVATEEREVRGIDSVTLATVGEVIIEMGDQESLRVEAEDNLLPYIETRVQGGTLTIRLRPNTSFSATKPIRYYLTATSLQTVSTTSSGDIEVPEVQLEQLAVKISSSGDIHIAGLSADSLDVQITSSGSLVIDEGEVDRQNVVISSSGKYEAGDVRSATADVRITSSGDATIWVTERLDVRLMSSGDAKYYGRPEVTQSVFSSGRVVSLGDK